MDRSALIPYEQAFKSKYARNLRISHFINERISTWNDDQWDQHIRVLKTIPPKTLAKQLQSEFSLFEILSWILLRPTCGRGLRTTYAGSGCIRRFRMHRLGSSK